MSAWRELSELLTPLREPLARVRAHWWELALAASCCALAALLVSLLMPPTWRAVTTVRIRTTEAQVFDFSTVEGNLKGYQDRERRFQTMQSILRSRSTMAAAAARLQEQGYPLEEPDGRMTPDLVRSLVSFSQEEGTEVVRIAADHRDPEWARKLAWAVAEAFEEVARDKRREQASNAFRFLDERAATFKDELLDSEQQLDEFRRARDSIELEREHGVLQERLDALEREVAELQRSTGNLAAEIEEVQRLRREHGVVSAARWFDDPTLSGLLGRWQEAEVRAQAMRERYKADYLPRRTADQELAATLSVLDSSVDAMMDRWQAELRLQQGRLANDREELGTLRARTQDTEAELGRYQVLVAERDLRRNFYTELASRYTQVGLDTAIAEEGVQILDEAHVLPVPVSPRTRFNVIVGLFLGTALGLALVVLREREAAPLRGVADIERIVGGPVLTAVPRLEDDGGGAPALSVGREDVGIVAEAMRELRAGLAEHTSGSSYRVLLVTSALPAEGKTMISSSLALSLARAGDSTLLVDTDLRRPRIERVFGTASAEALDQYLASGRDARLHELTTSSGFDGLTLVTSVGHRTPPVEALASRQLARLIEEGRTTHQHVVLDSPPILSVVDAAVMAHLADGILLVVNPLRVAQAQLSEAMHKLRRLPVPIVGVVVNGAERNSGYGYEYGYRYAYRYSYRYGYEGAEAEEVHGEAERPVTH
jgi:capsular exopolysaccharide synthesis family protein